MLGLPLAFAAPAILAGLLALPVIWLLLRATPPRPQDEVFAPIGILRKVMKTEETPQSTPWWLTALRLLIAALLVVALAGPIWNPREEIAADGTALALMIDNGWASARDWSEREEAAAMLIEDARARGVPVYLALTVAGPGSELGPFDGTAALERLAAAEPQPVPSDRAAAAERLAGALADVPGATFAYLSDGLAGADDEAAFEPLRNIGVTNYIAARPDQLPAIALTATANEADALVVDAIRPSGLASPQSHTLGAYDERGRRIADAGLTFGAGASEAQARFEVPLELRNDVLSVSVDGALQAGATRALDEGSRRRRVALIASSEADRDGQPLLAPLFYLRRALSPFADIIEPRGGTLGNSVDDLLQQNPAIIIMADVGVIPDDVEGDLRRWVENGGTLVRFAGPRLAAAQEDSLLPVRLRSGQRQLGGALSWSEPQPVAPFPADGPFGALTAPRDVTVTQQVLAEPTTDLAEKSWATLEDGTPLVTGETLGAGRLVLFHVTPEASWSNLPISGSFVEMLRQIVQISSNQGEGQSASSESAAAALPPYRTIAADGSLSLPAPGAEPIDPAGGVPPLSLEHPPGLYGAEDGLLALNLLDTETTLDPIEMPEIGPSVTALGYGPSGQEDLRGPFFAAAGALLLLDTLAMLWLGGFFNRFGQRGRGSGRSVSGRSGAASASIVLVALAGLGLAITASPAMAQSSPETPDSAPAREQRQEDISGAEAVEMLEQTRLGYVETGSAARDDLSRAGLRGLSAYLTSRTALEPGEPVGLDIASDELSFFPLIYWRIDPDSPMPSDEAVARIDAYMANGGTVLFDTADQYGADFGSSGGASPATQRLRDILGQMNVPPLEPVPNDHVLSKSFYLMANFPGRFSGSPLWIEAGQMANGERPVRQGDGVSPILITANDFAGAWAVDDSGNPLRPTVPNDAMQRIYAYRAGVNIMMYMLTGNYKADQVHIPALLERLGQ